MCVCVCVCVCWPLEKEKWKAPQRRNKQHWKSESTSLKKREKKNRVHKRREQRGGKKKDDVLFVRFSFWNRRSTFYEVRFRWRFNRKKKKRKKNSRRSRTAWIALRPLKQKTLDRSRIERPTPNWMKVFRIRFFSSVVVVVVVVVVRGSSDHLRAADWSVCFYFRVFFFGHRPTKTDRSLTAIESANVSTHRSYRWC